ncbi:SIMPL domain-containing protein [Sphingomonas sp. GM_Shp_1]|uniref:SIMPL domain-containing protein n=1 Tax=Sphingomonas sp. GM_Shp_1 TaxID=2937381 RepID=UPI00226B5C4B|nr:SIMPL domain-containing protein [Sphingomonas sp. GM_Shp_1]
MKAWTLGMCVALTTTAAVAQTSSPSQILVSATGTAQAPPDRATISYTVRGEGATSDEATTRLRDQAKTIRAGAEQVVRGAMELQTSDFAIQPVRSRECNSGYGQVQLSTGACAIQGYVATMPVRISTPRVADAGTLVGVIGRLGGLQVQLQDYGLSNSEPVRQKAMRTALAGARAQAQLIAEGSGQKLGRLLRVQDSNYREVVIEMPEGAPAGASSAPPPPPPPPPPSAPVRVDLSPAPVDFKVTLMVAYAIDQ